MFGIADPLIFLPYLFSVICVAFALWYSVKKSDKDDKKDEQQ
ncbi:hypothetical protein EZS27_005247 [termite gut metagenome]|uniref:Uncharacterized protein n=1 Tax=termite gut metagenome TaxID=433724 RepID=A0A5J4SPU2_9ZZZZ